MRDIFNSLKAKVDILKAFDKEIADKREKIKNTDSVDPKKLLKEYQDNLKLNSDIKQLEEIRETFTRPDVLENLVSEFCSNVTLLEKEAHTLTEKAEELRKDYINSLKALDVKHYELQDKFTDLRQEYISTATELGFEQSEVEFKLQSHFASSGARIISREGIYLD